LITVTVHLHIPQSQVLLLHVIAELALLLPQHELQQVPPVVLAQLHTCMERHICLHGLVVRCACLHDFTTTPTDTCRTAWSW
jgi:hypothetical protein